MAYVATSQQQVPRIVYRNVPYRTPQIPKNPGWVSQPIFVPGRLTSAAALSERLPDGVNGGATEVNQAMNGIFGRGSNVLVPAASSTAAVIDVPKSPTDPGAPDWSLIKRPSAVQVATIPPAQGAPSDEPQLDSDEPSQSSPQAPQSYYYVTLPPQTIVPSVSGAWRDYFMQPRNMLLLTCVAIFVAVILSMRS